MEFLAYNPAIMGGVCHALIFLFNLSSLSLSLNHDSEKNKK
jgi:hypothetical protein